MRIEDLDRQRCKKEFADLLMDDLLWLGLRWDEGPIFPNLESIEHTANDSSTKAGEPTKAQDCRAAGDLQGQKNAQDQNAARKNGLAGHNRDAAASYFQSERDEIYQKYFSRLEELGLIYDCFCRRADLLASSAPHAGDGTPVYGGTCRNLLSNERARLLKERQPAKRIRAQGLESIFVDGHYGEQKCGLEKDCGDFVIRRADKNFSYQFAVTVDDALMGVTQVARGRDLLLSTHQQLYLYKTLGLAAPRFYHFPLLVDAQGRRLSKRDKDLGMDVLRSNFSPQEVIGKIMALCGFVPHGQSLSLDDALELFDWSKMPKADIVAELP